MSRTVLHVAQPTTAGVARVVADLVADQVQRGWDVHVACPSDGDLPADVRAAGATQHHWPAARQPGPSVLREVAALRRVIRRVRPELVHLHSAKAGLAGRLALRRAVPTMFSPHAWSFLASGPPLHRATVAWERLAVRWTDAVAVVSEAEQAQGVQHGVRASYAVVPNGVPAGRFGVLARHEARASLGLPEARWVVCAGRLSRQKGQDLLLAAWPAVRRAVPDARLALVGDGPDAAALAASAPPDVLMAGASSAVDLWLSAADLVALPSRWEAASVLLLEAMASGRSVVAGRADGMLEALRGDAGAVVDAADPASLASALVTRLRDPELAAGEGAVGRARVQAEYDLAVTTARVADLYDEVLLRRR